MNNSDEHLQKSNIQQIFIHLLKQIPAITDLSLPEEKITAQQMIQELLTDTDLGKKYISFILRKCRDDINNLITPKEFNLDLVEKKQPTENQSVKEFSNYRQAFVFDVEESGTLYVYHLMGKLYQMEWYSHKSSIALDYNINLVIMLNRMLSVDVKVSSIIENLSPIVTGHNYIVKEDNKIGKTNEFKSFEQVIAYALQESEKALSLIRSFNETK